MSTLRLGNMSPEAFAEKVGAEFTEEEMTHLKSVWSQQASLTGAEDFHIFEAPAISITVGSAGSKTIKVFAAANQRKVFNREITIHLDSEWEKP